MKSAEQQARDMLARMGVPDAQSYSSGDLVELANLIATNTNSGWLATPKQWDAVEESATRQAPLTCILELRARVEALEQQNRELCWSVNNAVVWNTEQNERLEALEAAQRTSE